MSTATDLVRPVRCTVHGPMAFDAVSGYYLCGLRGACLVIPAYELEPYFRVTTDEIKLTPPAQGD